MPEKKSSKRFTLPLLLLLILSMALTPVQAMDFSDGSAAAYTEGSSDFGSIDAGSSSDVQVQDQSLAETTQEPTEEQTTIEETTEQTTSEELTEGTTEEQITAGQEAESNYEITLDSGDTTDNFADGESSAALDGAADGEIYTISGSGSNTDYPGSLVDESVEDRLPSELVDGMKAIDSGLLSADTASTDAYYLFCASDTLRADMVNRSTSISIHLDFNNAYTASQLEAIYQLMANYAFKETDRSYEGDYLQWSVLAYDWTASYSYSSSGGLSITYKISYTYSADKAQENYVTQAVASALSSIGLTGTESSYIRIKKIYDYICANVVYDTYHYNLSVSTNNSLVYPLMYSAYAAICNHTSVCQGYATLLYRLLREAEVPVRCVSSKDHIWNIVYLKGSFYNVDATWDSSYYGSTYQYFLENMSDFYNGANASHNREDKYNTSSFCSTYPMSQTSYTATTEDYNSCSHQWGDYVLEAEPTCTANGYQYRECRICGLTETQTLAAGHSFTEEGTYNSTSNTHKAKCSRCSYYSTADCTFSNGICTVCGAPMMPGQVTGLAVSSYGYNKLKLTWTEVSGATGYLIYRQSGSKWVRIGTTSSASYIQTTSSAYPIVTGTSYSYKVRAYTTANSKTRYGNASSAAKGKARPNKVSLSSVSTSAYNKVTIKWRKAAGATHYRIYYRAAGSSKWTFVRTVGSSTLSYTHTSSSKYPIVPGKTYYYTVVSYNSNGKTQGTYNATGLSVKTTLARPTNVKAAKASTGITLSWSKSAAATGYVIYRYQNGSWVRIKTISKNSTVKWTDTSVTSGNSYRYCVRCYRSTTGGRGFSSATSVTCTY